MTEKPQNDPTADSLRLSGDAYQAWSAAARDSEHALDAWLVAPPRDQPTLYAAYRASLDREEAAACELERRCVRAGGAAAISAPARIRRHRFAAAIVREMPPPRSGG